MHLYVNDNWCPLGTLFNLLLLTYLTGASVTLAPVGMRPWGKSDGLFLPPETNRVTLAPKYGGHTYP